MLGILIPLSLISFSCIIIWRAGDGFMLASEYIGRNLSDGVRGATINAIASSMPEVFTSLFFLFVLKDARGFSGGIGTTAGSAIFNGMVIPSLIVIAVVGASAVKKVKLSLKVIRRDGISLIIAELIFLIIVSGDSLNWYHGLFLVLIYLTYLFILFKTMDTHHEDRKDKTIHTPAVQNEEKSNEEKPFIASLLSFDLGNIFIRKNNINNVRAWSLLIFSTFCIALVCYFLVIACEWIGSDEYTILGKYTFKGLDIPVMFVALILASAASSFPDTIISVKDAKKGNYEDAISNVLGSNIFDICFALGLPLMIFTIIYGPIHMPQEIVNLSSELRLLLWILTIVAVVIFLTGKYFGRRKAFLLLTLYFVFVLYVVGRGTHNDISEAVADFLLSIVKFFRF